MKTIGEIARTFGCTEAQARAQLRANLDGIRTMQKKAASKGVAINGYTQADLASIAKDMAATLQISHNA